MRTTEKSAVLSLGRIYCDLVFTGLADMPHLGREIFARDMVPTLGGGALITAAHCAMLGRPAALVARYGTDPLSMALEAHLDQPGLHREYVERSAQAGPQVTVVMTAGEERAFLSRRAGHALPDSLDKALAWARASHLHIAEYATLHERPNLVALARQHGLSISLDPSWDDELIHDPDFFQRTAGIDLFLPNLEEAAALTGHQDPMGALAALAQHFPSVALKLGARGAIVTLDGAIYAQDAPTVPVIDTTGAGDAFNAGFIDAWLDGKTPNDALAAAIECGSRSVQHPGGLGGPTGRLLEPTRRAG
ncbi:carbohydrate kinase family protein [Pelagibacterium limicola]|uniref:carbohydrate kinase family protein n=1 Tax=Pelagibacterium limicola TaxID=2791022 RepID=UPI0018AF60FA|nr:PfkB family carbohydrate kinase [Pelagibacterium limicola]